MQIGPEMKPEIEVSLFLAQLNPAGCKPAISVLYVFMLAHRVKPLIGPLEVCLSLKRIICVNRHPYNILIKFRLQWF